MTGVIFDTVAIANGAHHLDIEMGALLHALRLDDSSLPLEFALPPFKLFENCLNSAFLLLGGENVVRLRINRHSSNIGLARNNLASERIDSADGFDLASPKFNANRGVFVGRMYFDDIAADAKCAAAEIFRAIVLNVHKSAQHGFARDGLPFFEHEQHAVIRFGRAETVDARNGGDDDYVAALE
jgi:hypothetical protein